MTDPAAPTPDEPLEPLSAEWWAKQDQAHGVAPPVGRAAELAAIVRFTLPKPQGLDGKMCECVECRDKARAFAALSELAALAAEVRGQLADEMGLTEQQRARAEAAEAERDKALMYAEKCVDESVSAEADNTRLRAALKRGINQLQGNIAREEVAEMLRDALDAAPNEDA